MKLGVHHAVYAMFAMVIVTTVLMLIYGPKSDRATLLRERYSGPISDWPKPSLDPGVTFKEFSVPPRPERPEEESPKAMQIALGQRLFQDPILSASGQISCESCHNRRLGWGDGLPRSFGHDRQEGSRNAPTLFGAGLRKTLFWDGRAATLQEQAIGPLLNPIEMANETVAEVLDRLNAHASYPADFAKAFGHATDAEVSQDMLTSALASFQSQLMGWTRFDSFLSGNRQVLDDQQLWGLHLFRTKARCVNCHYGPLLTDDKFHALGVSFFGRSREDLGRYNVTNIPEDAGRFRTPSLRFISETGPYMHNGIIPRLRGVVNFYDGGGGVQRAPNEAAKKHPAYPEALQRSRHMKPLELTKQERAALVAFLETL